VPLIGYLVGRAINDAGNISIDKYILPMTGLIVVLSLIPVVLEFRKARKEGREKALVKEAAAELQREDSPLD